MQIYVSQICEYLPFIIKYLQTLRGISLALRNVIVILHYFSFPKHVFSRQPHFVKFCAVANTQRQLHSWVVNCYHVTVLDESRQLAFQTWCPKPPTSLHDECGYAQSPGITSFTQPLILVNKSSSHHIVRSCFSSVHTIKCHFSFADPNSIKSFSFTASRLSQPVHFIFLKAFFAVA